MSQLGAHHIFTFSHRCEHRSMQHMGWDNPEGPYPTRPYSLAFAMSYCTRMCDSETTHNDSHNAHDKNFTRECGYTRHVSQKWADILISVVLSRMKNQFPKTMLIVHASKKVGKGSDTWPIIKSFWNNLALSPWAEETHKRPSEEMQCVSMTTGSQCSPLTTALVQVCWHV